MTDGSTDSAGGTGAAAATPGLPEIREADAPPALAALYADMCAVFDLPLVNLIYRHLATMPGCLEWSWSVLRPQFLDGRIPDAAAALRQALPLPDMQGAEAAVVASAGSSDLTAVARVLDVYNRGNSMNLIALRALLLALAGSVPQRPATTPAPAPVRTAIEIPPLPRLDELAPDAATLVRGLAARHPRSAADVVPSLYLHLCNWPALLPPVSAALEPLFADDRLVEGRDAAYRLAGDRAAAIAPLLSAPRPDPDPAWAGSLSAALTRFTTAMIPEMLPVGLTLSRWLAGKGT